jgi:RNA polymerase sigma-70 factor (ECF subfamily)
LPEILTDEQLLERASRADETAFRLLYERHRNRVFRFAYRMLGSVELAEDVTHDCFLSLIRHPARFDPARATLGTYLYAAARNLAIKHYRNHSREVACEDEAGESRADCAEEPLQKLLDQELSTEIRKAVASLPPLQREALILFEYEELALAEIASIVGAEVGTVKSRIHRAREQVRKRLAPYLKSDSRLAAVEKRSA